MNNAWKIGKSGKGIDLTERADEIVLFMKALTNAFYTNSTQLKDFCKNNKGWLVFIPDEKVK